jgi:hypothetical protein
MYADLFNGPLQSGESYPTSADSNLDGIRRQFQAFHRILKETTDFIVTSFLNLFLLHVS